ncbi:MAG TPA: AAA family ATPase [Bradyrhizobium sp.]|nr:AAA family ATPase [Bradyrhizobium sp.]
MISYARQNSDEQPDVASPSTEDHIAPAPRVSVQAFCETVETAAAVQSAGEDRRLGKAHLKIQMGGMVAAIEAYRTAPTPNVIILETDGRGDILVGLDQLASVCDAGTRVIVIGRINDVGLYRELVRRGVSDYLIAPINAFDMVRSVCNLYAAPEAKAVGRVIAVVGAKGGVGASTLAHNVAWAIARDLALDSVVADLDLAFGTAGLDYNQDPPQGIADAVFSPDRIDTAFIDRLLSKCTDHLSLLAAPATLERVYDFGAEAFDAIFDTLRSSMPCVVLDIPHQWSGWTRRAMVNADDILIVATPDLASLRNTKNIFDLLKASRPNDRIPAYCLNQVGIPKRPEISAGEFAKAIESPPIASIPFEPQIFGAAANNGQMIAEVSPNHRVTELFLQVAQRLTGRAETKKPRGSLLSPFLEKLRAK